MATIQSINARIQLNAERIRRVIGVAPVPLRMSIPHPHEWRLAESLGAIADALECVEPKPGTLMYVAPEPPEHPAPIEPLAPATALVGENQEIAL